MGQITHPTLGSPMAMVTSNAELLITGSRGVGNTYLLGNVQLYSGLHGPLGIDKSSYAILTIDYEHHEIHDGDHYNVRGDTTITSSGGSTCFYLFTPNGSKWTHLVFEVYSDNLVDYKEQINCLASGATLLPIYNCNLNSTNVYMGSLITSPLDVTNSGTVSATGFFGAAGQNPNVKGVQGERGRDTEIILKSGTGYIWTFKAGGNNTKLGWDAEWYEHTDKIKQF